MNERTLRDEAREAWPVAIGMGLIVLALGLMMIPLGSVYGGWAFVSGIGTSVLAFGFGLRML